MPSPEVAAVLAALDRSRLGRTLRRVERWAETGRGQLLAELVDVLVHDPSTAANAGASRVLFVVRELLPSKRVPVSAFLGLAPLANRIGTRLAASRSRTELLEMFAVPTTSLDVVAHTLHAAVLRQGSFAAEPAAVALQARLVAARHPLAWLPLAPTALESSLPLASFGPGGSRGHTAASMRGPPVPARTGQRSFASIELADAERRRLEAAFEPWTIHSNGRTGSASLALVAGRADDAPAPSELSGRGLPWLEGTRIEVTASTPAAAMRVLFGAAANGGAYGGACDDAEGRLRAWTSAAALAGAGTDAPFEDAHAAVLACRWFAASVGAPWFAKVAWDVSLVVARPGGSLALLAATDTD